MEAAKNDWKPLNLPLIVLDDVHGIECKITGKEPSKGQIPSLCILTAEVRSGHHAKEEKVEFSLHDGKIVGYSQKGLNRVLTPKDLEYISSVLLAYSLN